MEIATRVNGESFAPDQMATDSSIDHGMSAVEFMVFCDENPPAILCECGCKSVSEHNAKVIKVYGYQGARF